MHPISIVAADVPVWPGTAVVAEVADTVHARPLLHRGRAFPSERREPGQQPGLEQHPGPRRPVAGQPAHPIFNRYPGECPRREAAGPVLVRIASLLGWGPLGAMAGALLRTRCRTTAVLLGVLALMCGGIRHLALLGLVAESAFAWMKAQSNEQPVEHRATIAPTAIW